jgi:hypothetical protein
MQVTKFNLVTDLQIMLSNVPYSSFLFECNTERGCIDQLYIELGRRPYENVHCLNKRERPLHSERTSILRDEATLNQINDKYPALLMAGYFVVYNFCYRQRCQILNFNLEQQVAFLRKFRSLSENLFFGFLW